MRPGEELDAARLQEYLTGKVPGVEHGLSIEQFGGGHSNLTYLLHAGAHEYVLRRPPLGPVPPKAHDMAREYRVLAAVQPHFPEAPAVFHLCEDTSVIGAVFFVMQMRRGKVVRSSVPPKAAREISEALVSCLARLHAIDVAATGLVALGKPEGFLERQVQGWAERWQRAKLDDIPHVDQLIAWLEKRLPVSPTPALVHNDYKLDNVMVPPDSTTRIEAVLDWEMTTVGDPLFDAGITLCYWTEPGAITTQPGWYTREEFIARYAELSGRDLSNIAYYEGLGIFKLAVILQQIYFRFRRGQTVDQRFAHFGKQVAQLMQQAAQRAALS